MIIKKRPGKTCLKPKSPDEISSGLCQMVLMTSKTSLQKWSGVFLFLPLIRKARTRCDLTEFHLAARSAQVLSLGRLACWRSSRPGARGLSARFHTLSLSRIDRFRPAFRLIGSILNGVDDDFSTPFFVFTKYLRNAIK